MAKMDTTFYEDQSEGGAKVSDVNMIKKHLTLDLNGHNKSTSRKQKLNTPILSSPDLHMLKLASPELEKLIIQHNGLVTTTPTPSAYLPYAKTVTEGQEQFARGFEDALAQMHQSDSSQGSSVPMDGIGDQQMTYTTLESSMQLSHAGGGGGIPTTASGAFSAVTPNSSSNSSHYPMGISIKDELQTVPCLSSPPVSPINMENQEKIKLERKRQRNRVAASKCRKRKLERIARLEDRVNYLKNENTELNTIKCRLKSDVCALKEEMMQHVQVGCQILLTSGQYS